MPAERWQQISQLYHEAAQVDSARRAAFLDRACDGDSALRRELVSLLAHDQGGDALIDPSDEDDLPSAPLSDAPLSGARIGAYELQSLLGAGGMGEVYRARDTRLNRDVAFKILPGLSALDEKRLARFRREAHTLAALNHPNIAQIYGVEEADGCYGLVLELVEGPTLAARIAHGELPLEEALAITRQIVDALQAAHARGVVHRDLKPANIKVRADGTVKVLDFGMAKPFESGAVRLEDEGVPAAPTLTGRGVIAGTVAYMAPEQARGQPSDARVDVWAVGVTLYEMLTGRSPFAAEGLADTMGAVLYKEPDWDGVPDDVQPLLRRCLEKAPARRLQSMADLRGWLDGREPPRRARRRIPAAAWIATAALAAGVGVGAWSIARAGGRPAGALPVRFEIAPPPQSTFASYFVVSPDGRYVASVMVDRLGERSIWLHSLERGESRPLAQAVGISTSSIVWSPDSRFIGFVDKGAQLKKIAIAGGAPQTIVRLVRGWAGGAWSPDDAIIVGQRNGELLRIPSAGGSPSALTALDPSRQEVGHGGARMLPDGRHFIYSRESSIRSQTALYVGSLERAPQAQAPEPILVTEARPAYAPAQPGKGHLLIVREGVLLAYPFDERRLRLEGDPVAIADHVEAIHNGNLSIASASASANVLAYRTVENPSGAAVWIDRNGRATPIGGTLDAPAYPRVSPDGQRIAIVVDGHLWVYHTDGRPPIKLTFTGDVTHPLWTRDGRRILYADGGGRLRSVPSDRVAAPDAAGPPGSYQPYAWTPDGDLLAAAFAVSDISLGTVTDVDVVRFAPVATSTPKAVVKTPAFEGHNGLALSPDGSRLAYTSDVTGNEEIWVRPLKGDVPPVRVSPRGGVEPRWAPAGDELYYLEATSVMAVAVGKAAALAFGPARVLFENPSIVPGRASYDVARDGRFIALSSAPYAGRTPTRVVLNWTALLSKPAVRD